MDSVIRILVEDILIFAYCDEEQIDEDYSVGQLERIAGSLKSAGRESIDLFLKVVQQMTEEARKSGEDERASRLATMAFHLGLGNTDSP